MYSGIVQYFPQNANSSADFDYAIFYLMVSPYKAKFVTVTLRDAIVKDEQMTEYCLLVMIVLQLIVVGCFGYGFSRKITSPIEQLTQFTQ